MPPTNRQGLLSKQGEEIVLHVRIAPYPMVWHELRQFGSLMALSPKILVLLGLATSWLTTARLWAADFELVGREMVRMLQNDHYARLPFNEEMSGRIIDRYLGSLDPQRWYFLQGEVAEVRRRYGRNLHDLISTKRAMPFASEIYNRYRQRVLARVGFSRKYLEKGEFSFESDRKILQDRSTAEWAFDEASLEAIWRDSVDALVLEEILRRRQIQNRAEKAGKPDPFRDSPTVASKIIKRFDRLERTVVGVVDGDVADAFFSSIAKAYDPHSDYFTASEMARFRIDVSNQLVGIGARLAMNDEGETVVEELVPGGPADQGGQLKEGDRIFAVSGANDGTWQDITFQGRDKVIRLILGEKGSEVGFRLRRSGENGDDLVEVSVERDVVVIKEELARARIVDFGTGEAPWKIGILVIPSFYLDFDKGGNGVSDHVEKLLNRLVKEGIQGLVLDLRDNVGGSLNEVQRVAGFFLGKRPVVQIRFSNGQVQSLTSSPREPLFDGPLVTITNRRSASATEILAGALQDYNRAILIGASSTFGKGTVQKTESVADQMPVFSDHQGAGHLKLTFQKYYRVSGSSVQTRGVVPDLVLPEETDGLDIGEKFDRYALPHDVIQASPGFKPEDRDLLFLPGIKERSATRVLANGFFNEVIESIKLTKARKESLLVSLSLKERLALLEAGEVARQARLKERSARFQEVLASDSKQFKAFRLTLEDLAREELPLESHEQSQPGDRDPEGRLVWPNGLDAMEREALEIVKDLQRALKSATDE